MARIEAAVMARARRFMPFVVALLFLSGFALFDIRCDGFACIGSRFGWLLSAQVALAFGVLAVFVTAVRAAMRGTMDPCRFRHTHRIELGLMVAIRSEEHTSELPSLLRSSYAAFCLKQKHHYHKQ